MLLKKIASHQHWYCSKWGWTNKLQLNANPNFSSGRTSKHQLKYKISTKYFNLASSPGRRNTNIPPAAIPGRCVQAKFPTVKFFPTLIFVFFIGCADRASEAKTHNSEEQRDPSLEEVFKRSYDIPELKNYKDSSKYIVLFTITKRYNNNIIIELSEIANGINLCVKQPVVLSEMTKYDSLHSLPFNQLCYWYADDEAIRIKDLFKEYDNNKIAEDISCKGCLDPETWKIEIYNHGRYSSMTKDAYGKYEPFIDSLFTKVHLNKKNGFRISTE